MTPTKSKTSVKTNINVEYPEGPLLILCLLHRDLPLGRLRTVSIPTTRLLKTTSTGTLAPTLPTDWRYTYIYCPFAKILQTFSDEVEMDPAFLDSFRAIFPGPQDRTNPDIEIAKKLIVFSSNPYPDRQISGSTFLSSLVGLTLPDRPTLCLNVHFEGAAGRHLSDAFRSSKRLFPTVPSTPAASLPNDLTNTLQSLVQTLGTLVNPSDTSGDQPASRTRNRNSTPLTPGFRHSMGLSATPRRVHFPSDVPTTSRGSTGGGDDGDPPHDDDNDEDDDDEFLGGHPDPPWDAPQRSGFRYALGRERVLAARGTMRPVAGMSWQSYFVDPNESDLQIDPATNSIRPWTAVRPDFGLTVNHPVRIDVHYMDHELFLATYQRHFNNTCHKYFISGFPVFAAEDNDGDFAAWHGRLVSHCMEFHVYLPPLHTLRDNLPLGVWFEELPAWTQQDAQSCFPALLSTCLKSKAAGLTAHKSFLPLLHHGDNGYRMLYNLAVCTGHPLLQTYPTPKNEPRQKFDDSIPVYLGKWEQYLHHSIGAGKHLSDRYFLLQVSGNMHTSVQPILGNYLDQEVARYDGRTNYNTALPASFAPDQLVIKLLQHAIHLRQPELVSQSPRDRRHATLPVRSLQHTGWQEESTSNIPDDPNIYDLNALIGPDARKCFFCQSTVHLAPACPQLKLINENPMACRMIKGLLTSPSRLPASASPAKQVRQVEEDLHLPLDASSPPSTTDSHSSAPSVPDFR